jgi:hypothetical protein
VFRFNLVEGTWWALQGKVARTAAKSSNKMAAFLFAAFLFAFGQPPTRNKAPHGARLSDYQMLVVRVPVQSCGGRVVGTQGKVARTTAKSSNKMAAF